MKKVFSIILFMFFVLHTFADEPLLIPENYIIYSKNERYFLDCNTKENITICYEIPYFENNDEVEIDYICELENHAIEKWKITECGLNAYISNNGEFCVLDFHGELVPTNVYKNYVLFKVYKNGKEHGKILLSDLVQKKRNLQKRFHIIIGEKLSYSKTKEFYLKLSKVKNGSIFLRIKLSQNRIKKGIFHQQVKLADKMN